MHSNGDERYMSAGLLVYLVFILVLMMNEPWEDFVWNNEAVKVDSIITSHETAVYNINGDRLYTGYVTVVYGRKIAQLQVDFYGQSQAVVKHLLAESYAVNTTVVIYYDVKQPSKLHLGPKSIVVLVIWVVFSVVLAVVIVAVVTVLIRLDRQVHKSTNTNDDTTTKAKHPPSTSTKKSHGSCA